VSLLSTFVGELPKSEVKRFDRKQKQHVQAPCPAIVSVYNKHMGNVDLLDSNIGRFHSRMKSRKWYFHLFYHLLDISVVNAWVLNRYVSAGNNAKTMSQKKFRLELAQSLCQIGPKTAECERPRSLDIVEECRTKFKRSSIPPKDVRLDSQNHWPVWKEKRTSCKYPSCKGYTFVSCEKCSVNLCLNKDKNCFKNFHQV
jgi:hypothetical protein